MKLGESMSDIFAVLKDPGCSLQLDAAIPADARDLTQQLLTVDASARLGSHTRPASKLVARFVRGAREDERVRKAD